MKIFLLVAYMIACWSTASAETSASASPKENSPVHDQVKAARAKEKADDAREPKERWWDRDSDGKRPWDKPTRPSEGLPKP
jgi:hypothetical protein